MIGVWLDHLDGQSLSTLSSMQQRTSSTPVLYTWFCHSQLENQTDGIVLKTFKENYLYMYELKNDHLDMKNLKFKLLYATQIYLQVIYCK